FVDDTFNLQPNRAEAIFREIIARGLQCNYYFPAGLRAELMSPELVDLMVEAGTIWVTYAVETVVPRLRQLAGRAGNSAKAAQIIDYTADRRIMVGLFFMIGFPTETRDEAMATLDFVRARRHTTMPYFFAVKYFPGTELTRVAQQLGAIDPSANEARQLPYHDVSRSRTSTLSENDFQELFTYYMREILLDGRRLSFALDVQEQYLSSDEMAAAYGALLGRKIDNPRRVFRHALAQAKEDEDGQIPARAA
ncbi:MAG TPA: radical SAM protein, partial [Thermoguttaceae bacterium]|nr:radical SAM protein [Thermoguttaceae bacterium]